MGLMAVQSGLNRFKAFIFYLPDIYVRISQKFEFSAIQQMELLLEIVSICQVNLTKGNDIDILLSEGIPTVLDIFSDFEKIKSQLKTITDKFETNSTFSSLLQVKYIYQFFKNNFSLQVNVCKKKKKFIWKKKTKNLTLKK